MPRRWQYSGTENLLSEKGLKIDIARCVISVYTGPMKTKLLLIAALLSLTTLSAFAEEKNMCGYYAHDEESFTGPEKSTLDVRGRGIITLDFGGTTPLGLSDGESYCCFGEYSNSQKSLRVLTGCEEN